MSLKTALLADIAPAKFDQQITTNLLLSEEPADTVRKEKLLIGIRNEDGEIYRLIGATKHNSFTNAIEELEDLELEDELHDTEGTRDGCDAIFSQPE